MITESWHRILVWLQNHGSEVALHPPATEDQISEALCAGLPLTADLQTFYRQLNGAKRCDVFPSPDEYDDMAYTPLPLNESLAEWEEQNNLVAEGQFADCVPRSDPGIIDAWWSSGWVPFAGNGGGDLLCVDIEPSEQGVRGQVISHSHESGEHKLLATSLSEYLSTLANNLEAGKFECDPKYGVRVPPVDVTDDDEGSESQRNPWTFQSETLPAANDAFRKRDYAQCVKLLEPYEDMLDKVAASKLAIARKRSDVR